MHFMYKVTVDIEVAGQGAYCYKAFTKHDINFFNLFNEEILDHKIPKSHITSDLSRSFR